MLAQGLLIVTLLVPGPASDISVYGRSAHPNPANWRSFQVASDTRLNREDKCRARFDASRFLRNKPVTQGVPPFCRTDNREPDAAPS